MLTELLSTSPKSRQVNLLLEKCDWCKVIVDTSTSSRLDHGVLFLVLASTSSKEARKSTSNLDIWLALSSRLLDQQNVLEKSTIEPPVSHHKILLLLLPHSIPSVMTTRKEVDENKLEEGLQAAKLVSEINND
jgi:hypothetical protein